MPRMDVCGHGALLRQRHLGQSKRPLLVGLEQTVGGGLDVNDPMEPPGDRRGILQTKQSQSSDVGAQSLESQPGKACVKAAGGPWDQGAHLLGIDRHSTHTHGHY